jgi:hypothetical protein
MVKKKKIQYAMNVFGTIAYYSFTVAYNQYYFSKLLNGFKKKFKK